MCVHGRATAPDVDESHTVTLQKLLTGYEFPDTIFILAAGTLHIHSSAKKRTLSRCRHHTHTHAPRWVTPTPTPVMQWSSCAGAQTRRMGGRRGCGWRW